MTTTIDQQVQVLLDLAGITPTADELETLVGQFPKLRASVEALWALDLDGAQPSMVFRAAEAHGPQEATA